MSEPEVKFPRKPRKKVATLSPKDLTELSKTPPNDFEAERGVVGSLLVDPEVCDDVIPLLKDDDFYYDIHRRIYRQLAQMRNENSNIDLTLLVNRLRQNDELDAVGGIAGIAEIMDSVPTSSHAVSYARIVRDKSTLRKLIHTGSEIIQEAYVPNVSSKDLLGKAASQVIELAETQSTNQVTDMETLMSEVLTFMDRKTQGFADGVKTGFIDLDNLIDALHPNELIIAAARPSMGKTAFALNIAEYVAFQDRNAVLVVSLEMTKIELATRLICSRGKINSERVRKGHLTKEEAGRFQDVAGELSQVPMFIDDTSYRTVAEIAAVARKLKRHNDLKLLVVDYIGLITPEDGSDPRQEQVAKIARRLKGLARELHIPVLCLAQLNRSAEGGGRDGNRPKLAHLRESGAIEQDADVVMFIHREERYHDKEYNAEKNLIGKAEIIVAKQRNGATDDINLVFVGEHTRFLNAAEHAESEYVSDFGGYSETQF